MAGRRGGSLSRKLALILFIMGAGGSIALGYFLHERGRRAVLETETVRGQSLAHTLRFTIESWLVDRMISVRGKDAEQALRRTIYNVASLPSIEGVEIFDRRGQSIVAVHEERLDIGASDPLIDQAIESRKVLSRTETAEQRMYFYVPLVGGTYVAGVSQPDVSALLVFSIDYSAALAESNRSALTSVVLVVLLIGFLTLLLYMILERLVLQPAEALAAQADKLGQGDLSVRSGMKGSSSDEIGRLAQAFDGMAERLESAKLEAQRAAEALRESEGRLRRLVEANIIGVVFTNADGSVKDANDEFLRTSGYSREDLAAGRVRWSDLTPAEFAEQDKRTQENLASRHVSTPVEKEFRRKDGSRVPVLVAEASLGDEQKGLLAVVLDTTELQKAEHAFHQSEERYRRLVENAPEAIVVMDIQSGRFVERNPAALKFFGLTTEELLRVGPAETSPVTQPDGTPSATKAMGYVKEALDGGSPHFEWVHKHKDGTPIPCEIWLTRIPAEGRMLVRGSITDIRERKKLEDQLRQLQKVESIGRLAGGVAHDFNNLLAAIMGFAELARSAANPVPYIDRLLESARRGAGLTQQLLAFARRKIISPEAANMNALLLRMQPLLRTLIGEDVEIDLRLVPKANTVKVDVGSMEQVVMNLCVNARDAMPSGGRLTLETQNVRLDEQYLSTRPDVVAGDYLLLAISDTGCGMNEKIRERLFEPFFTTKAPGKGTGLGLAMCQGIVKQAGGHIAVYSEVGEGTTFKIYLPVVQETIRETAIAPKPVVRPGTETILLVEDDEFIRSCTQESLGGLGYKVLVAANGKDALEIVEKSAGDIHLLITDVVMPQMGGRELAAELAQRKKAIKVLFASGYTENAIVHNGVLNPGLNFIQKPFGQSDLARMVRKLLDQN